MKRPIIGAPPAGGPSTPALAAALCEARGFGFVAAGYKSVADVARDIAEVRATTQRPFGVNIFYPARLGHQVRLRVTDPCVRASGSPVAER
jgi:nitronate monooxygenase